MGEQLSMLDTMFLVLEQSDEAAHMHIGAALIFDPLPRGGAPGHRGVPRARARPHRPPAAVRPAAVRRPRRPRHLADLGARRGLRPGCPRPSCDAARAGGRGGAARMARGLLVASPGPPAPALGDGAPRRPRGRPLGARDEDPPLPRRRRRLGRRRRRPARRLTRRAAAATARAARAGRSTRATAVAPGSRRASCCAARGRASARRCTRGNRSIGSGPRSSWSSARS